MHKIVFYPVGNGDTSQIILDNGKRLLFDFRHQKQGEDPLHPNIDLAETLRKELKTAGRDYFDVVAFTHGDKDHIAGSTEFFELEHANNYKGSDRIKIRELWVPAAMILEMATHDDRSEEFIIWRQEARYRLKQGKGIQVFSSPKQLEVWLKSQGQTLESKQHLITDAGKVAKGFSLPIDEIEFFCHSPFAKHVNGELVARNEAALIFQVRFEVGGIRTNYMAIGDSEVDVLNDIVDITNYHNNGDRLDWHILNIPHHCSWKAIGLEKGDKSTTPTEKVKELLMHGQAEAYLVSSSNPIGNDKVAYEQTLPPHIQAKNTYEQILREVGGRRFLVTMEEPNTKNPEPIVFEVGAFGFRKQTNLGGVSAMLASPASRVGGG